MPIEGTKSNRILNNTPKSASDRFWGIEAQILSKLNHLARAGHIRHLLRCEKLVFWIGRTRARQYFCRARFWQHPPALSNCCRRTDFARLDDGVRRFSGIFVQIGAPLSASKPFPRKGRLFIVITNKTTARRIGSRRIWTMEEILPISEKLGLQMIADLQRKEGGTDG